MTVVPVLPESAPFTPQQRAWLNGFFAGLVGRVSGPASSTIAALPALAPPAAPVVEAEEDFPWHDPALSLDERLKLAEGRSMPRMLMAAMAQLDCGACGYLCKTYAEAIASGTEKDLSRCAPGGRETSKKLKELFKNSSIVPAAAVKVRGETVSAPAAKGGTSKYDRLNPCPAPLVKAEALNKPGSIKDTRLVVIDLKNTGLTYNVGDSLGVYPENCPDTVQWILNAIDATGTEKVSTPDGALLSLREALETRYAITRPLPDLLQLLFARASADEAQPLRAMLDDEGPGIPEGVEVLDLLLQCPSAKPEPEAFVAALAPMQPRLYSISSSLKAHPEQVHLTVGVVRYVNPKGRQCKGVASTFLAERAKAGKPVRVFVQPAHGFALPENGDTPVIMVGPGTGIAPFRAFLQERKATKAKGPNWLLFGDQRREFDFLYEQELLELEREGVLSKLDLAFSRDQDEKIYVQHRLLQRAAEVWAWLKQGAHFYVCGDAKRMAKDVDDALRQIVMEQGNLPAEAAKAFLSDLAKSKRYQRDVY